MDLNYSAEELCFRDEVRAFVRDNLPQDIARKVLDHRRLHKDDMVRWQDILAAKGWLVGPWPREYGGCGWSSVQAHIFDEETAALGAPRLVPFGLAMVAPVIMAFGSPWQKEHYLARIRENKDWWCQGYSEPGSGSDLASLKMRAVRQGDHYVVNGQKAWTTLAQHANMIFCLVRTSTEARKQEGISFLLIDMRSPGVTVRPIITLDGEHNVNEVFMEDVQVPVRNLVGEEGKGWTYAKYLLGHERTNIAGVGASKRELAALKEVAQREFRDGRPLAEDPIFAARIAQVEIELMALEMTVMRVLSARSEAPGPEASILKIRGTEIQQTLTELMMEALGPYALPFDPEAMELECAGERVGPDYAGPLAAHYFGYRKVTIYGGSNEIQRNIIAQMVLGL
ncbi:MAG: pimeloyl-CoA dehydrogenase large subunit [Betaproteobacteria bacterium RBG_16_64_18]|nr:MAG: pimeloyl-CoA dehydrogenase large subunit [Betaproteobacteria bacterium RBG_16_64_18]OGA11558.1 MAG: pimeloyl-CoA dehydrogenase large subunit [Betaproteobacteria bacterium RIFCSPLOWO2_02_FULL_65_20]